MPCIAWLVMRNDGLDPNNHQVCWGPCGTGWSGWTRRAWCTLRNGKSGFPRGWPCESAAARTGSAGRSPGAGRKCSVACRCAPDGENCPRKCTDASASPSHKPRLHTKKDNHHSKLPNKIHLHYFPNTSWCTSRIYGINSFLTNSKNHQVLVHYNRMTSNTAMYE